MPTQRRTAKSPKKSAVKKSSAKSASRSRASSSRGAAKQVQSRGRSSPSSSRRSSASSGGREAAKGASRSRAARAPNAIDLLTEDHRNVQKMFRRAERLEADDPRLQEIVQAACAALTEHAEIEEELLYPALEEQSPDMIEEAHVEHDVAKQLIAQLEGMQGGEERYKATFKVLGEYVNHHVEEEESQIFRQAKRAKLDLAALGEQILARKAEGAAAAGDESEDSTSGSRGARSRGATGGSARGRGNRRSGGAGAGGTETDSRQTSIDEENEGDMASTGGDSADDSERPGRGGRGRLLAGSALDDSDDFDALGLDPTEHDEPSTGGVY